MEGKNTLVSYMYRDGANYKLHFEEVVSGCLPDEEYDDLLENYETDAFYPENVGMPAPTFVDEGYREYEDDPDSHELTGFERTDREPTVATTMEQLAAAIRSGDALTPPKHLCESTKEVEQNELVCAVHGGKLVAQVCGGNEYPGISIEFVPDEEPDDDTVSEPCVVMEMPARTHELRVFVWSNPHQEDYTHKIECEVTKK